MPDRVVSYVFRGDFKSLTAGLAASGKAVGDLGTKLTALDKDGAKKRAALSSIGSTAGKIGLAATAGFAAAAIAAGKFDQAMSSVEAATHETAGNMELLRAAALKAGADTAFSATEAAGAIEELAKAGISTQDILGGGLKGALNLAAAGGLDVAQAAETAATAMTQFKLSGQDVNHVADLLAAGAGKAQGSVSDLGMALKQGGLVAAQTGLSVEETVGALGAFASAGLIGSDAGTAMKTMLQSLTPSSEKAAGAIDSLGISAYDQQGQFIGLEKWAGRLRDGLKDMSAEQRNATLKTIFGSDAVRAASIIYENGAAGVGSWIDKVNDSGYAADTADKRMQNLAGDLEKFKGSLETALIGAGEGSQGPLRKLVQGATAAVNAFNDLPPAAQGATSALAGLVGVTGGSLWFGSKVIGGIADTKRALSDLNVSADRAARSGKLVGRAFGTAAGLGIFAAGIHESNRALGTLETTAGAAAAGFAVGGPWGAAVGGAIGLTVGLAKSQHEAAVGVEDLSSTLDQQTGAITKNTAAYVAQRLEADGVLSAAQSLGIGLSDVTDAALGNDDALGRVNAALEAAQQGFFDAQGRTLVGRTTLDAYAESSGKVTGAIGDTSAALKDAKGSIARVATASGDLAGATGKAGAAAGEAAPRFEEMSKALDASRKRARATADSFMDFGSSLSDSKVSLNEWIASMRKQANALRNFRENAQQAAKKGLDEGLIASLEKAGPAGALRMRQLANATKDQIGRANGYWRTGQREVDIYTDKVGGVPKRVSTTISVETGDALAKIAAIKQATESIKTSISTTYYVNQVNSISKPSAPFPGSTGADGATVPKTGLPYADRHLYLLADGEEVISNRRGQADRFRADRSAGRIPAYGDGGTVSRGVAQAAYSGRPAAATAGATVVVERIIERMPDRVVLEAGGEKFTAYVQREARGTVDAERNYRKTLDRMGVHD